MHSSTTGAVCPKAPQEMGNPPDSGRLTDAPPPIRPSPCLIRPFFAVNASLPIDAEK